MKMQAIVRRDVPEALFLALGTGRSRQASISLKAKIERPIAAITVLSAGLTVARPRPGWAVRPTSAVRCSLSRAPSAASVEHPGGALSRKPAPPHRRSSLVQGSVVQISVEPNGIHTVERPRKLLEATGVPALELVLLA